MYLLSQLLQIKTGFKSIEEAVLPAPYQFFERRLQRDGGAAGSLPVRPAVRGAEGPAQRVLRRRVRGLLRLCGGVGQRGRSHTAQPKGVSIVSTFWRRVIYQCVQVGYLRNPSWPGGDTRASLQTVQLVPRDNSICQLRLDFLTFTLDSGSALDTPCDRDRVSVNHFLNLQMNTTFMTGSLTTVARHCSGEWWGRAGPSWGWGTCVGTTLASISTSV